MVGEILNAEQELLLTAELLDRQLDLIVHRRSRQLDTTEAVRTLAELAQRRGLAEAQLARCEGSVAPAA